MGLQQNVINALMSEPIHWVNFMHQGRFISPVTFYFLAVHVQNGKVKTKTDSSIEGRVAKYDAGSNTIIASDSSFGSAYWDEKALLIHEAAHAILDGIYMGKTWQGTKSPMKVVDDEMIGYLAGAFYLVAANAAGSSQSGPEREALKIAKAKLLPKGAMSVPKQPWPNQPYEFTAQELLPLRTAVAASPYYKDDAQKTAVHDGF